jgi:geranylgeranyl reductase family protein
MVSKKAIDFLLTIGIQLPADVVEQRSAGVRINTPLTPPIEVSNGRDIGILVVRRTFDKFLADQAAASGVEVRDECNVRKVVALADSMEVITSGGEELRAKYVVGADGVHSTVARDSGLAPRFRADRVGFGIVTEVQPRDENSHFDQNLAHVYYGIVPFGIGWVLPKRDHLNVGIGGRLSQLGNSRMRLAGLLQTAGITERDNIRISAGMIPVGGLPRRICSDRVLLVGDAAGFVDSWTGEGIYYAMLSGRFAAEAISRGIGSGLAARSLYAKACHTSFGRDLRASMIMAYLSHRISEYSIYQLSDPAVHKHILLTTQGEEKYRDYFRRFLVTNIWKLPGYLSWKLSSKPKR